jgi:predicted transcriptional regulator
MKSAKTIPTDLELEILKLIWRRGSATVRDVYLDFQKERKIAYTTVLTMMGVLERKGHLTKKRGERAYVYSPAQPQARVMDGIIKEFVNRVFNGSPQCRCSRFRIRFRQLVPSRMRMHFSAFRLMLSDL